jgi:N-acetylglutamate synthase-like GNAT family acetyltransferase
MIRLEDKELEDYVLGDECHIAMPFELHRKSSGENEIITYSFTVKIAEEFEKRFGDNPFTTEARKYLSDELKPIMEKLGYDCADAVDKVHYEYRCTSPDKSKILPMCEIIDTLDGENYGDIPLDEFSLDSSDESDRMAVIREDGKIVCFAGLNDIAEEDGCAEITVECDSNYREKGYGSSCVAALTDYLLSLGNNVKYVCTEDNIPSIKTAEAVGFVLYDKCLPFVCYRDTENIEDDDI